MSVDPSEWTVSSQTALNVSLAEPERAITFPPKFTYPIFGDAEQIFGYKNLRIDLAFDCHTLKPMLGYRFSEKLTDGVIDIEETIGALLPPGDWVFKDENKWLDLIDLEEESGEFNLPQDKIIYSYPFVDSNTNEKSTFNIYKFNLKDPLARKLVKRFEILVLLYIEAGSYINADDPLWDIYLVYKNSQDEPKPTFVGFTTCYKHWKYEGAHIHDAKAIELAKYRGKISQFIILPPFQRQGHGKILYDKIIQSWLLDDKCVEITVEDPSEEFDELRDSCDLRRIIESGILASLDKLPISNEWKENTRKSQKMVKRQFDRVLEMSLLWLHLNKNKQGAKEIAAGIIGLNEKNIRLEIKKRIYLKNKDALDELQLPDMRDKLQTTYERVQEDYEDMLEEKTFNLSSKRSISDEDLGNSKKIKL
ncbi:histone acetyltransferase catalytic subunit [Martiniozyma asiatica (nom. inval.)]|nr:histone acetyltransferase catalytic subunit [Martiniozyma asiatica]